MQLYQGLKNVINLTLIHNTQHLYRLHIKHAQKQHKKLAKPPGKLSRHPFCGRYQVELTYRLWVRFKNSDILFIITERIEAQFWQSPLIEPNLSSFIVIHSQVLMPCYKKITTFTYLYILTKTKSCFQWWQEKQD